MLHKEAKKLLDEEIKKVNLACNANRPTEDEKIVFCEFLLAPKQQPFFISDLNIGFKVSACITFREIQEADDLNSLVFEKARGALRQLMGIVEDYLECLSNK